MGGGEGKGVLNIERRREDGKGEEGKRGGGEE